MLKKKLFFALITPLMLAAVTVGIVFAYFTQEQRGWDHEIVSTIVSFKFNGRTFGSNVASTDLKLTRGEEAEVGLTVRADTVSTNLKIGYSIKLSLDGADTTGNELARAVECYLYENGTYKYIGMLDKLPLSQDPEAGYYELKGFMPANEDFTYKLKLIYSPAAGDAYEKTSFTLNAVAETEDAVYQDYPYAFATNLSEFKQAVVNAANKGKTLLLFRDIVLDASVKMTVPMSINLNGHTISGGGLTIEYDDADMGCSIFNSGYNPNGSQVLGGGITSPLTIVTSSDFYPVYSQNVQPQLTVESVSADSAAKVMQKRFGEIENKTFVTNDELPLLAGFGAYFSNGLKVTYFCADTLIDGLSNGAVIDGETLEISAEPELTAKFGMSFLFDAESSSASSGGLIEVRGNEAFSLVEYMLAKIPDPITGSVFLPERDVVSGASVSWFVEDGKEKFFTSSGAFLPLGYEGIGSWDDTTVTVGVKVSLNGVQYTKVKENVVLSVSAGLSAEKRTQMIYSFKQIVLAADANGVSILSDINGLLIGISKLKSIEIVSGLENNPYVYAVEFDDANGVKYFKLTVLNSPLKSFVNIEDIVLRFTYDMAGQNTYDVTKIITVLGHSVDYSISDSANSIQTEFENSAYTRGESYDFSVSGNIASGVLVEYSIVNASYNNNAYLLQDPVFTPVTSIDTGYYYVKLANGQYAGFDSAKRFNSSGGEIADGDYVGLILYDGKDKTTQFEELSALLAANNVFKHSTKFTVRPGYVPPVDTLTVVNAKLYETVNTAPAAGFTIGERVYKTDSKTKEVVVYRFTFVVGGIYHNIAAEIADNGLYNALLLYYDNPVNGGNNDGFISISESKNAAITSVVLKGKKINSAKGIEYFELLQEVDLSAVVVDPVNNIVETSTKNNIEDISYFSALTRLRTLDLSYNRIANIQSLTYLDTLTTLKLSHNNITSLAPIEHLENIQVLDVSYNDTLRDFSYISNYLKLTKLNVEQTTSSFNSDITYFFALIAAKNPSVQIVYNRQEGVHTFGQEELVAALVMSRLILAAEVERILYVPKTYTFREINYTFEWTMVVDPAHPTTGKIVFDNSPRGYTITVPVVDEEISITLKIVKKDAAAVNYSISKTVTLTLLQSQDPGTIPYIEYEAGKAKRADVAIPDAALRAKLFTVYNSVKEGKKELLVDEEDEARELDQQYVLTIAEIAANGTKSFGWANAGITDLTGIELFTAQFSAASFNLSGNNISDYGKIKALTGLKSLTLGGSQYDFSKLVDTVKVDGYYDHTSGGLTSLEELYVYDCYGLSDPEVLKGLFLVYLAHPSVKIFIEPPVDGKTNYWRPIETFLAQYVQGLPHLYKFDNLGSVNLFSSGGASVPQIMYGVYKQNVTVTAIALYNSVPQADVVSTGGAAENFVYFKAKSDLSGIEYVQLVGYTQSFYARIALTFGPASLIYPVQLAANVSSKMILTGLEQSNPVHNKYLTSCRHITSGAVTGLLLGDIFTSRSISSAVMRALTTATAARTPDSNGYIHITLADLALVTKVDFYDGSYVGSNALSGLELLTNLKKLELLRDARLGDGSNLINIQELYVGSSGLSFSKFNVNLPNLKVLYLGFDSSGIPYSNKWSDFYDAAGNSVFLRMPNLTILKIGNNLIKDYSFLSGLAELTTNDIKELWVGQDGSGIDANTGSLSDSQVVDYIKAIWEKSTVLDAQKIFTINNVLVENIGSLGSGLLMYLMEAPVGNAKFTQYAEEHKKEYAEAYRYNVRHYGIKTGAPGSTVSTAKYVAEDANQDLVSGGKLYLPYSTFNTAFGADYTTNAAGTEKKVYANRAFMIYWGFKGITSKEVFDAIFDYNAATFDSFVSYKIVPAPDVDGGMSYDFMLYAKPGSLAPYDGHLELKCRDVDYYMIVYGEVGKGFFMPQKDGISVQYRVTTDSAEYIVGVSPQPISTAMYPIKINGSAFLHNLSGSTAISYSVFKDRLLRFYVFALLYYIPYTNSITTSITSFGQAGAMPVSVASQVTEFSSSNSDYQGATFKHITATSKKNPLLFQNPLNEVVADSSFNYTVNSVIYPKYTKENLANEPTMYFADLSGLGAFTTLNSLTLNGAYAGGTTYKVTNSGTYGKLPVSLKTIALPSCSFTDCSAFSHLENLTDLNLSNNALSDISGLKTCSRLATLNLQGNKKLDYSSFYYYDEETDTEKLSLPSSLKTTLNLFNTGFTSNRNVSDNGKALATLKDIVTSVGGTLTKFTSVALMVDGKLTIISEAITTARVNDFIAVCGGTGTAAGNAIYNIINSGIGFNSVTTPALYSHGGKTYTASFPSLIQSARSSFPDEYYVPMEINDGVIKVTYMVKILNTGATTYTMNGHTALDFDPLFFAFLALNSDISEDVLTGDKYLTYKGGTSIELNTSITLIGTSTTINNVNISSLRGLNFVPGIQTLTVNKTQNTAVTDDKIMLTELWSGAAAALKTVYLYDAFLNAEQIYGAFNGSPLLEDLDLRMVYGVNYLKSVSGSDTVANTILPRLSSIKINPALNVVDIVAHNIDTLNLTSHWAYSAAKPDRIMFISDLFSPALKIFGVSATAQNAQSIAYHSAIGKIFQSGTTTSKLLKATNNTFKESNPIGKDILPTANSKVIVDYMLNLLSNTDATSPPIPGRNMKYRAMDFNAIPDSGVEIALPKSLTYYDKTINISWSLNLAKSSAFGLYEIIGPDGLFRFIPTRVDGKLTKINDVALAAAHTTLSTLSFEIAYTFTISDVNPVVHKNNIGFSILNIPLTAQTVTDDRYYVQDAGGNLIGAENVFESGQFIHHLYTLFKIGNAFIYEPVTKNGVNYTRVMTTAKQNAVTDLSIVSNLVGNITSLEGIQIFKNLKTFSLVGNNNGRFVSIAPLRTLALETFEYTNSSETTYGIEDFSPLVEGSKNSLKTFRYTNGTQTNISDLSFLTAFTSLESVIVYESNALPDTKYPNTRQTQKAAHMYFETPSFRYVVAHLSNIGRFKVTTGGTGVLIQYSRFDSSAVSLGDAIPVPVGFAALPATAPTTVETKGAGILSSILPAEGNESFTYADTYRFDIKSASATSYYLPGIIDKGGILYAVEWVNAFGTARVALAGGAGYNNHDYNSNNYTVTFGAAYKTYSSGDVAVFTRAELELMLKDSAFTELYSLKKATVTVKVELDVPASRNLCFARLIARIVTDGNTSERMITIGRPQI